METPSIEQMIRDHFIYDADTGNVRWKRRYNNSIRKDLGISVNSKGYRSVYYAGRNYKAHRIAWLLYVGTWPVGQIDHINGDRSDNRIANLRDVTSAENQKNTKIDKRNTSGVSGVRWREDRKCWEASIRQGGSLVFLGRFDDFDTAVTVRRNAEQLYGFHPNHGRAVAGTKTEGDVK
jgi:hypothetical protein